MKNNTKLDRAKIFLPFDALKGLREALKEKERILVDKKILSIEEKEKISKKLIQIKKGMIIKVVYFENNEYIELEGMVSNIDFVYKKLIIVKKEIYVVGKVKGKVIIRNKKGKIEASSFHNAYIKIFDKYKSSLNYNDVITIDYENINNKIGGKLYV